MMTWTRLSILCLLLSPPVFGGAPHGVRLSFDGVDHDPSDREVELVPGALHRVTFTVFGPGEREFQGRLTRRLPFGQAITETRSFRSRVTFDLGPLTAPGRYEFEAGAVYFRGYQLELQVTGPGTEKTWNSESATSSKPTTVMGTVVSTV